MTSVPVMDIGLNMPYATTPGTTPAEKGSDFMGTLKNAMEGQVTPMDMNSVGNTSFQSQSKTSQTQNDTKAAEKAQKSEPKKGQTKTDTKKEQKTNDKSKVNATNEENAEEIAEETVTAAAEKATEVVSKVSETMNVSEMEVLEAVDELGFGIADLLDPSKMADLVAKISGSNDALSLVTDENLYQTLGELQEFVMTETEDLANELDLSQEALKEVLTQAEELMEQSGADLNSINPQENKEVSLEGMKDFKVTTTVNGEQVTMDVRVDDTTGAQVATYQSTGESNTGESSDGKQSRNQNLDSKEDASLFTQTLQTNNEYQMPDLSNVAETAAEFKSEAADIAEQIMESMKANLKPEMTELEMNLHPASLGNVRVNLTSQNGQITAQFLAQNETVRSAIESQVVQLTNQLEDQGIKVEHVEVAVANHSFERNNDNGGETGSNSDSSHTKSKAGRIRKIDLNAMDDEDFENLEDSDRIAAEMMAHNGNTVDYTA